ncbi:UNVERIFIED_CONTAM: hypothetical protein Slati_0844500 [Sesamum latifolium]|uniref:Uncharacterized protein n=1 Tax=Sesamum latifolium TaxID=2727402 RepID=A0AAW2XLR5_9LAMI
MDGDYGESRNVDKMKAFRVRHYVDDNDKDTKVKVLGKSLKKAPNFVDLNGTKKDAES